jgi:hypothetical protein
MYNPISWGISLFSFWLILWTTGSPSYWVKGVAWFSLVLSVILLVSIFWGWLRELFRKPRAVDVVLPIIFTISIMAFGISWMVSLPLLTGAIFHMSFWLGFIWMIAYLVVLVANVDRRIGITVSAALVIAGIVNLFLSLFIQGISLSVLGVILLLAALGIIPLRGKVPIF